MAVLNHSSPNFLNLAVSAALISIAVAHSVVSAPRPFNPQPCRLGGDPNQGGSVNCPGPCDLRAIRGNYAKNASPADPAAVWARGQQVSVKYQRNNHGPGGFNRLTLVHPDDMMNKTIHERNAFYYSCWGATPRLPTQDELGTFEYGYSFIGNDGDEHNYSEQYYETKFTVPAVVPDGVYILGHVWYGGTGGPIVSNGVQEPGPYGYFSDYWSCSYVTIRGGSPLQQEYSPIFENDMSQFSNEGCRSANDSPGVCRSEPCTRIPGIYQKPRPFKNGNPIKLEPALFGESMDSPTNMV